MGAWRRSKWRKTGSTCSPIGASRRSRSRPISTRCRHLFLRAKTTNICTVVDLAMRRAVEALLAEGVRNLGLLAVVGEERNSAGAYAAARMPQGARYLINGEPT